MVTIETDRIKMLEELIVSAAAGHEVHLNARTVCEITSLERDGRDYATDVLSVEYSGRVDDQPFYFKKNYSFTDDVPQDAFESLLVANSRLKVDFERLREAGIEVAAVFFTFQNCLMDLPAEVSLERPEMRLQGFINLARAGVPVSVDIALERPAMVSDHEGVRKKGFGCIATFTMTKGADKTTIKKLYGMGPYDDAKKEDQEDVVEVANKRLERDCERLRSAGMKVDKLSFWPLWEKVYYR
jgi:hypothetical protein